MFRKILVFPLFLLFFFLGNKIISAQEFPVESDVEVGSDAKIEKPNTVKEMEDVDKEQEEEYDFESMTTYELFWPLVAGKIPGDRFYNLKIWRDKLVGYLFFDKLKKSEYLKNLANKRLIEAEKLLEFQRDSFLKKTLQKSGENLEEGLKLLPLDNFTPQAFWLREEYKKDIRKHLIVLERMKGKAEESQQNSIENFIKKINELTDSYKIEI